MIAPNSIINGDCLEVMKDIADRSIDCIICDLPFAITACHWDKLIPFDKLWEQYKRIIKPNGAIALFGSQPFTSALVMSNPKWFKYEWIWEKPQGTNFGNANYSPMKVHENVIIFGEFPCSHTPSKTKNYNPQFLEGKPYEMLYKKPRNGKREVYRRSKDYCAIVDSPTPIQNNGYRFPKTVIKFKTDRGLAPTQKPVALIEYLIKTYTLENELILDNTAGSGTLAIAAINTNRQYICIEKDPHYFEVMRNRIANHDPFAPVKTKKPKAAPKGQLTLFDGGLAV
jgi:site-specific DNA-methyltransferase (adenine-specific)